MDSIVRRVVAADLEFHVAVVVVVRAELARQTHQPTFTVDTPCPVPRIAVGIAHADLNQPPVRTGRGLVRSLIRRQVPARVVVAVGGERSEAERLALTAPWALAIGVEYGGLAAGAQPALATRQNHRHPRTGHHPPPPSGQASS